MNDPSAPGTLEPALEQFLKSYWERYATLVVCGGTDDAFDVFFQSLLRLCPQNQYTVVIADIEAAPPLAVIRPTAETPLGACIRAALRQDPDAIVVDRHGDLELPLLWMANLTGHSIVTGTHAASAQEALQNIQTRLHAEHDGEDPSRADAMLIANLLAFVELSQIGVAAVWQARREDGDEVVLRLLFERLDGLLRETGALVLPPPPPPYEEDFSERALPDDWSPRTEPLLTTLRRKIGPHRRAAWGPVLALCDDNDVKRSKFGGRPLLAPGETWPVCGACQARLWLVTQLDLQTVPPPARQAFGEEGWFQFFYCVSDHCSEVNAWEPFAANRLVRRLMEPTEPAPEAFGPTDFRIAHITEWSPLEDVAHSEERDMLDLTDDERAASWQTDEWLEIANGTERGDKLRQRLARYLEHFQATEADDLREAASLFHTHGGDKILGWPSWTQGAEYPACPTCAAPMEMLLQINNDGFEGGEPGEQSFFGQLFAGDGNGHVFHCPTHRDSYAFTWSCG